MGKLLQLLSFASLAILSLGTLLMSENAAFWLASGSESIQIIRGVFIVILGVIIITKPPRSVLFRTTVGMISSAALVWTVYGFYNFNLPPLDSLAFVLAALTILISALEQKETTVVFTDENYATH